MSNIVSKNIEVNEYEIIVLENILNHYKDILKRMDEDAMNCQFGSPEYKMFICNMAKVESYTTHIKSILKKYEEA